jgi:hypothetical protein
MKTPLPSTDTDLAKQLVNSLLRDLFASAALIGRISSDMHGGHANSIRQGELAEDAFNFADEMLARSHTPKIIEQLKNL